MDRATLDLKVATFEAFAQSRCTKVVIYETDDSVARYNGRSFFRRTDYCNVSAHHCLQGNLTAYSLTLYRVRKPTTVCTLTGNFRRHMGAEHSTRVPRIVFLD